MNYRPSVEEIVIIERPPGTRVRVRVTLFIGASETHFEVEPLDEGVRLESTRCYIHDIVDTEDSLKQEALALYREALEHNTPSAFPPSLEQRESLLDSIGLGEAIRDIEDLDLSREQRLEDAPS